jgi:hypothetical protein
VAGLSAASYLVLLFSTLPGPHGEVQTSSPPALRVVAMEQNPYRIQFDGTLDDSVDETLRWIARSPTLRAERKRVAWITGGCCGAAVPGMVFIRAQASPVDVSASVWALTVAIALVMGIAAAYAYRLVDRSLTRNRCRKLVIEQLGGKAEFPVTIALLPDGVSVTQDGAHSTLSWTVATGVEDTGDGIELRFVPGFVVAPNRAFKDSTERARFLTQARAFAQGMTEAERMNGPLRPVRC